MLLIEQSSSYMSCQHGFSPSSVVVAGAPPLPPLLLPAAALRRFGANEGRLRCCCCCCRCCRLAAAVAVHPLTTETEPDAKAAISNKEGYFIFLIEPVFLIFGSFFVRSCSFDILRISFLFIMPATASRVLLAFACFRFFLFFWVSPKPAAASCSRSSSCDSVRVNVYGQINDVVATKQKSFVQQQQIDDARKKLRCRCATPPLLQYILYCVGQGELYTTPLH